MSFATAFSPSDLKTVFARFKATFGLKGAWALKDDSSEDAKLFTQEWYRLLRNCTTEEVLRGVDTWMAMNKDEWPKPGQLYGLILDGRPDRKMMVAKDAYDFDVCGCKPGCRWSWYRLEGYTPENGRIRRMQDCVARPRGLTPC